jgi:hypothetical protein
MEEKKQTAVEWLFAQIPIEFTSSRGAFEALQQAKQMERQQHGNTWDAALKAYDERGGVYIRAYTDFDDYEIGS